MKKKKKKKFWYKKIKEASKEYNWKFKGHFIFKKIDELFFSSTFFVNANKNEIRTWLGFKSFNIDNVFWDIIDENPNKLRPLSFRAEAAFCIRELKIIEYTVKVYDELNPQIEIIKLLQIIRQKVADKCEVIKSLIDFEAEMLEDEKNNTVGLITVLIEQKQYEQALNKIAEYKAKKYNSGFGFAEIKIFMI